MMSMPMAAMANRFSFASLDAGRRGALAGVVVGAQQALLTAAVDEDIPAELDAMRFSVSSSGVSRD